MSTHPSPSDDDGQDTHPSEDTTHDPPVDSEDSPLQAALDRKRQKVERLEEDTEVVQQVVTSVFLDNNYNLNATGQLRTAIVSLIDEIMQEHEEITISEVIMALWAETSRVSTEVAEAAKETDSDPNDRPADQAESDQNGPSSDPDSALDPATSSDNHDSDCSDESSDTVARMFQ